MDIITQHAFSSIFTVVLLALFFIFISFNDIADHRSAKLFKWLGLVIAALAVVNGFQFYLLIIDAQYIPYLFASLNHVLTCSVIIILTMVFDRAVSLKRLVIYIPVAILFVLEVINSFTHFLYELYPTGAVIKDLGNIYLIIYSLYALNFGLLAFQKREQTSSKELAIVYVSLITMVLTAILCKVYQVHFLQIPITAVCSIFYYFYIVSKQYKFDSLTGVKTRNGFYNEFDKYLGKEFLVAMIDLDGLKAINDQYGHYVGDIVLRDMCKIVCESVSPKTEVYRWGGDEFILFKLTDDIKSEQDHLDAIKKKLAESKIYVSYGMMLHKSGVPVDEFIKDVDTKLYEMKENHKIGSKSEQN